MITKLLNRTVIVTLSSLMAVSALAVAGLFAPAAAYAAGPQDTGTPAPQGPFADGSALVYACKQEKLALEGQQNRLDFANIVAGKAQTWIDWLKGQGKDTSALETALAAYKTAISTAQSQHDTAKSAYTAQAGFDGNCGVTDRVQARATLRTVQDSLRSAHYTIADGSQAFRIAVREWRRANRGALVPATATP